MSAEGQVPTCLAPIGLSARPEVFSRSRCMPSKSLSLSHVFTLVFTSAIALALFCASVPAETQSLETLLAYLKSPNSETRRDAARKLGERREHNQLAVEALVTAVRNDDSAEVRTEAVKSLGLIKDFSAMPDMLAAVKDSNIET